MPLTCDVLLSVPFCSTPEFYTHRGVESFFSSPVLATRQLAPLHRIPAYPRSPFVPISSSLFRLVLSLVSRVARVACASQALPPYPPPTHWSARTSIRFTSSVNSIDGAPSSLSSFLSFFLLRDISIGRIAGSPSFNSPMILSSSCLANTEYLIHIANCASEKTRRHLSVTEKFPVASLTTLSCYISAFFFLFL